MALPEYPIMSVEDYLIRDEHSTTARYEYLDGELRMLAGGSVAHLLIKTNLTGILYGLLRRSSCRVFDSDVRLQLSQTHYVYPDLTISCDSRDREAERTIRFPRVIVEVLSQTTEVIDRIKKFAFYRECPTLQEYVMIDSRKIQIEEYRRQEKGWMLYTFGPGDVVMLESIEVRFSVNDVYEDVKFAKTLPNEQENS